jgi:hypothetical protein
MVRVSKLGLYSESLMLPNCKISTQSRLRSTVERRLVRLDWRRLTRVVNPRLVTKARFSQKNSTHKIMNTMIRLAYKNKTVHCMYNHDKYWNNFEINTVPLICYLFTNKDKAWNYGNVIKISIILRFWSLPCISLTCQATVAMSDLQIFWRAVTGETLWCILIA